MKRSLWLMLLLFLVWIPGTAQGKSGFVWDVQKDGNWIIRLGASFYVRPEAQGNRSDMNQTTEDSDYYVATRLRLTMDLKVMKTTGLHLTLQDARYWGNGQPIGGKIRFSSQSSERFQRELFTGTSFFEAYLYVEWMQKALRLELGRIRLSYGDSFFLGDPGYIPQGQSFDSARLRVKASNKWKVDLLWFRVRESVAFSSTECRGNCFYEGDDVAGVYVEGQPLDVLRMDFYGFYYQRPPRTGQTQEMTTLGYLGMLLKMGVPRMQLTLEPILQLGRLEGKNSLAFALRGLAKYGFKGRVRPWIGLQFLVASGDDDPTDDSDSGYLPLFNNRRAFYGLVNLWGLSNLLQTAVLFGMQPHSQWKLRADIRYSFKFSKNGTNLSAGSYAPVLVGETGEAGSAIGLEVDARAIWTLNPYLKADFGGGVFLPAGRLGGLKGLGDSPAWMFFARLWMRF